MKINHKTCPGSTLISATRNDSGAVLILVLLLLALLTVVGSSAVTTSTIEVMISSNYNKSTEAFYIAEAGINHAKEILSTTFFNTILIGPDNDINNLTDNGQLFGGSVNFSTNGHYVVTVQDEEDEDSDDTVCSSDGDDDCWIDTNSRVIVTSTGTSVSGSTRQIEAIIDGFPIIQPGAISIIDNNNSNNDADDIKIDSSTLSGAIITGLDTYDNSPIVGDVPGTDTDMASLADTESAGGYNFTGDTLANLQITGINEVTSTACTPVTTNCDYNILSGSTNAEESATGPTEDDIKLQLTYLQNNADISISASNLVATSHTNFGTDTDPKITYISGDFIINRDITGYGAMVVEGTLEINSGSTFEYHGLIYLTCRGELYLIAKIPTS